jgi:hypothetical protein
VIFGKKLSCFSGSFEFISFFRSVGCIIIELLTGKPPYFDLAPIAAIFRIVADEYPAMPEGISQALRDFLFNCFQKEPVMRSSAAKLLEHPWLHNSSTNSNLEKHTSMLLGTASRSSSSREGVNSSNEADGIINAVRMFQREVSPNLVHPDQTQQVNHSTDGIAMKSVKVEAQSTSLSRDLSSTDESQRKREAKLLELVSENPLVSPTITKLEAQDKFVKDDNKNSKDGNNAKKEVQEENLMSRGLFRNQSENTLIKRILSSDTTQLPVTPEREIGLGNDASPSKLTLSANRGGGMRPMTPKSSFKSMKTISEDSGDSNDNWDTDIVHDLKSTSNDSTIGENNPVIHQIDLSSVKKGFITGNNQFPPSIRLDTTSSTTNNIARRLPSSSNFLRTKSTVSGTGSNSIDNIKFLSKGMSSVGILSPHQSSYILQKYQEKAEEENYDDLFEAGNFTEHDDLDNLSSIDTHEGNGLNNPERSIQTHIPLQHNVNNLNRPPAGSNAGRRPALEVLQTASSDDYDDLFDETDQSELPNFASKLKQKLNNWSKELAEDEMDLFINNQFEEKDFKQDEQKDINFRRSKDVVDLLSKIKPTVKAEEILETTNQILSIFDRYPEQRDHLITNHGVMPIMDMFESKSTNRSQQTLKFEIYGYNVLKIVNKIVEGSVRAQEQLTLVGIIPSIISFFERSCRPPTNSKSRRPSMSSPDKHHEYHVNFHDATELDPLAMEAARFIHLISISSSLTLQMLISAGGLSVLTTMASFGCKISSGSTSSITTSSHRRLHSWEELIRREEIKRSEAVEEVLDENSELLNLQISDRIYDSESKRYIEIFQMGMDCISRVFAAQKSRTRDFCRLFVKFGLLVHLGCAFENLMTIYKSFITKSKEQQQATAMNPLLLESSLTQKLHKSYSDSSVLINLDVDPSHKRTGSGNTTGNISRSESSTSMDAGNVDHCSEALYAQAIAAVFFKFSRSDAVVAETMANVDKGVIEVILLTLRAPELRSYESSSLSTLLTASPGASMMIPNPGTPSSSANSAGHRRTKSVPQPAYLEIVELLLKCLKNLSMEPSALDYLEKAGTMETLVPLLNGPISEKCKVHILPCIFNMCRINRRRQEQAAILGIVPHLKKVILEGSHLRQFALPIMFDLAHGSSITRAELWKNECVQFYVDLLKENYWQTFALNSLATWLSHETEKDSKVSNPVARLLVQPSCLTKLIGIFSFFHLSFYLLFIFLRILPFCIQTNC